MTIPGFISAHGAEITRRLRTVLRTALTQSPLHGADGVSPVREKFRSSTCGIALRMSLREFHRRLTIPKIPRIGLPPQRS